MKWFFVFLMVGGMGCQKGTDELNDIRTARYHKVAGADRPVEIQDLLNYQGECYADSSWDYTYDGIKKECFGTMIWTTIDNNVRQFDHYDRIQKHYTHREPTFEGFVKFLRNQH